MSGPRDYLLLRLESPMMAFGGPMVDYLGPTRDFPGQSQLTGLLGNALGFEHADAEALEALQARLRLASLLVRPGERLRDYHTVDLGRPHLVGTGWTTRGRMETRAGASSTETHIRHRWYLADACVLVALALDPPDAGTDLAALAAALDRPARPLFIGRKTCLPTAPIRLGGILAAATPEDALRAARDRLEEARRGEPRRDRDYRREEGTRTETDLRLGDPPPGASVETERLIDRRDWRNQMHTGARPVRRASLPASPAPAETAP